jgi:hypothetical protein
MASSSITALKMSCKTSQGDECYTPNYAIEPLLEFIPKDKTIYEPTSNISSNIVSFLNENEFNCIASNGRDFLKDDLPNFDIIITNPPYSKKDKFIEKCYELGKPFALLMPVTALQGNKRGQWFMKNNIEVLVLNQRVDFTGKGSPHFGVAWFCWNLLSQHLLFKNITK